METKTFKNEERYQKSVNEIAEFSERYGTAIYNGAYEGQETKILIPPIIVQYPDGSTEELYIPHMDYLPEICKKDEEVADEITDCLASFIGKLKILNTIER